MIARGLLIDCVWGRCIPFAPCASPHAGQNMRIVMRHIHIILFAAVDSFTLDGCGLREVFFPDGQFCFDGFFCLDSFFLRSLPPRLSYCRLDVQQGIATLSTTQTILQRREAELTLSFFLSCNNRLMIGNIKPSLSKASSYVAQPPPPSSWKLRLKAHSVIGARVAGPVLPEILKIAVHSFGESMRRR